MNRPIVIIHGWSDSSASFKPLADKLSRALPRPVELINLSDYISRDDDVTYDDITEAMNRTWRQKGLPRTPASVDVVVHSTGGLVIRDWLQRYFKADSQKTTAPVKNLVMLAPANFGSPLAHKGRAFFGRTLKGWDSEKMFEVGEKILKGLELASPYSWELAQKDRFGAKNFYGKGKILCTVLVGNTGYKGISAAANEDGSDGTIRLSTANMNCVHIAADFRKPRNPKFQLTESKGRTAFCVMDKENHSTIAAKGGFKNPKTFDRVVKALTVDDQGFNNWCTELDEETAAVMAKGARKNYTHGYQNTVFFVRDQFGNHVQDYFLEFYIEDDDAGWLEELFHRDAIRTVHAYGDDKAYRSVMIDCTILHKRIDKDFEEMKISLTAYPQIGDKEVVGYNLYPKETGGIKISKSQIRHIFQANRTVLVDVLLQREQVKELFRLKRLE